MHFDWTISIGNVIQLLLMLGALVRLVQSAMNKITKRMQAMERRVDLMWGWIVIQMNAEQREQYETWVRNHPERADGE